MCLDHVPGRRDLTGPKATVMSSGLNVLISVLFLENAIGP